ncbi:MAG: hypothetical protein II659_08170 [Bacteroidales bacterium]|nr:hypothetical protein [Bacteroidales bacterium]
MTKELKFIAYTNKGPIVMAIRKKDEEGNEVETEEIKPSDITEGYKFVADWARHESLALAGIVIIPSGEEDKNVGMPDENLTDEKPAEEPKEE